MNCFKICIFSDFGACVDQPSSIAQLKLVGASDRPDHAGVARSRACIETTLIKVLWPAAFEMYMRMLFESNATEINTGVMRRGMQGCAGGASSLIEFSARNMAFDLQQRLLCENR